MYEEYWKLSSKPFNNTPDPKFFYKSQSHEEVLMRLHYTIEQNLGAAVLTGVFGCGKTVVGQVLCDELPLDKYRVAFINNPQLDYVDLLRSVVRSLKSIDLPAKKSELSADYLLELLGDILENNLRDGRETIIIIDEAHIIKNEQTLEGLRLLLNFQSRDRFLLTLFLFGQPELKQQIEDNKQLDQRIAIKCHLGPFSLEEVSDYINYRINIAGVKNPMFDESAIKSISNYSGGIPRRINRACDLSLLLGMYKNAAVINGEMVNESLQNLGN
ncbi:MAG: AAA family ATPase [bacterium]